MQTVLGDFKNHIPPTQTAVVVITACDGFPLIRRNKQEREIDEARTKGRSMKLDKISLQIFANPFWAWELDLQTIVSRWPLLRLASRWLTPSTPFGPPTGFELCLGCQISASPDLSINFQQFTIKLWKTTPFLMTLKAGSGCQLKTFQKLKWWRLATTPIQACPPNFNPIQACLTQSAVRLDSLLALKLSNVHTWEVLQHKSAAAIKSDTMHQGSLVCNAVHWRRLLHCIEAGEVKERASPAHKSGSPTHLLFDIFGY